MPEIKTVEGDLYINSQTTTTAIGSITHRNETLTSFGGFNKLEKIGGTLTFSNFAKVTNLPDVSKATIGGYHLYYIENLNHELDFSNTTFLKNDNEDCEVKFFNTPVNRIIGQQTMECTLNFQRFDITNGFPELENIEVLNGFILEIGRDDFDKAETNNLKLEVKEITGNIFINTYSIDTRPHYLFPYLENVGGYFCIKDGWGIKNPDFSAPKLSSVGGQLALLSVYRDKGDSNWKVMGDIDLSNLKKVGCAANIQYYDEDIATLNIVYGIDGTEVTLPALEKVGGNGMRIGIYYWSNGIPSISCPKLNTVEGKFELTGHAGDKYPDDKLDILEFPLLTKVGSFCIEYFEKVTDFSTFAPLFTNNGVTKENWNIVDCGYNPSYEDMVNGKYTKE